MRLIDQAALGVNNKPFATGIRSLRPRLGKITRQKIHIDKLHTASLENSNLRIYRFGIAWSIIPIRTQQVQHIGTTYKRGVGHFRIEFVHNPCRYLDKL